MTTPERTRSRSLDRSAATAPENGDRTARKRRAILEAATTLFLDKGYVSTNMEEIASLAAVSKQTVYKQFSDKETLFREIVLGVTRDLDEDSDADVLSLPDGDGDVEAELLALAGTLLRVLLAPRVLRLRRLVIAEAARFPELGRAYWEAGFERGLAAIAARLRHLTERGILRIDDVDVAAGHFAGLLLWVPMNKIMFCGVELADDDVARHAASGVTTFLAAHRRPG